MKTRMGKLFVALAMLSALYLQPSTAFAQGTAFTYQGRLNNNGSPAAGTYNLTFALFNTNTTGVPIAGPVTNNAVIVTNGLFTVPVDFGPGVFTGATNWLQIGVETNGASPFSALTPRQQLTPTPYAIYAENAGGIPGLAVQPNANNAPSLIGGSSLNFVSTGIVGAAIGGGGATNFLGISYSNSVTGDFGTVGGGVGNTAGSGYYATVAGGFGNIASGGSSAVVGGAFNLASGSYAMVGGGFQNTASGIGAFIGGGGYDGNMYQANQTAGNASFIGGGLNNNINAGADYSAIVSGQNDIVDVNSYNSAIVGGAGNWIGANTDHSFIGGGLDNSMLISGGGTADVIAGGEYNGIGSNDGSYIGDSVISGGNGNQIQGFSDTIGGGTGNYATTNYCTVGGGIDNDASGISATVAGGGQAAAPAIAGAKPVPGAFGGAGNTASGDYSFVGGGRGNTAGNLASVVSGGEYNTASYDHTTVAGGSGNNAGGSYAAVGGGQNNNANGAGDVLAGGFNNSSGGGNNSTISGGNNNNSSGSDAVIGGGQANQVSDFYATIGGGVNNIANNNSSLVCGGTNNVSGGYASTVAGGSDNAALGDYSFAAGNFAQATNNNSFVWSDGSTNTVSTTNNQFIARASNGFVFLTSTDIVTGVSLAPGATSWATLSDRNAKKDFAPVDTGAVLDKLAAVPVEQWHYKWEADASTPNLGPMAQDFIRAFYPGRDDKSITTLEFDGVELAAIQGLNEKLEVRNQKSEDEIEQLKAVNAELKQRLEVLEQIVLKQKPN